MVGVSWKCWPVKMYFSFLKARLKLGVTGAPAGGCEPKSPLKGLNDLTWGRPSFEK